MLFWLIFGLGGGIVLLLVLYYLLRDYGPYVIAFGALAIFLIAFVIAFSKGLRE